MSTMLAIITDLQERIALLETREAKSKPQPLPSPEANQKLYQPQVAGEAQHSDGDLRESLVDQPLATGSPEASVHSLTTGKFPVMDFGQCLV